MAPTATAAELLATKLSNHIPNLPGWTVTQTPSGGWTVNTPAGSVRIKPADQWTIPLAEKTLERLQDKGMDTALAKNGRGKAAKGAATNGHQIAFTDAEKTPPVYPGDPSPDDGPVRRKVLLTPELARQLRNRPWEAITSDGRKLRQRELTRNGTEHFVKLIRKNKLGLTYQGLGIGLNGSLYDGQHRCAAVEETGVTVEVYINYNVTPDEVLQLDSGRQRRASTKLSMAHFDHALALGSATRLLYYYLEYEAAQSLGAEDGELLSEWRKWCNTKVDDLTVEEIVHDHPGLYQDLLWAIDNKADRKIAPNPPAVAVLRYLARRAWPEADEPIDPAAEKVRQKRVAQAEATGEPVKEEDKEPVTQLSLFLNAVIKSVGITSANHVAITLQRWLEKTSGGARVRYMREAHLFALIKAWNLFVDPPKKPVKSFTEHLGNQFPLPYNGS